VFTVCKEGKLVLHLPCLVVCVGLTNVLNEHVSHDSGIGAHADAQLIMLVDLL
jgi:hypothetical protein